MTGSEENSTIHLKLQWDLCRQNIVIKIGMQPRLQGLIMLFLQEIAKNPQASSLTTNCKTTALHLNWKTRLFPWWIVTRTWSYWDVISWPAGSISFQKRQTVVSGFKKKPNQLSNIYMSINTHSFVYVYRYTYIYR